MGELGEYLDRRARSIAEEEDLPWGALEGTTVLVTGATGLIGSALVRTLSARARGGNGPARIVAPVRDLEKASRLFGNAHVGVYDDGPVSSAHVGAHGSAHVGAHGSAHVGETGSGDNILLVPWSAGEALPTMGSGLIVHGAAPTASADFVNRPVEVIASILDGTLAALELARREGARKLVLLSTMEVYGSAFGRLDEEAMGPLDPVVVRSSYPEAKRLAECLVASYASEYDVPGCVLRLAQTFGEGVPFDDGRAFADFGRHAVLDEDVVMFTEGTKRNSYLSVDDAVRAIVVLLAHGKPGEAYNGANEATYMSVRELAEQAIESLATQPVELRIQLSDAKAATYRADSDLNLDASKLRALGWQPKDSMDAIFRAMGQGWDIERVECPSSFAG